MMRSSENWDGSGPRGDGGSGGCGRVEFAGGRREYDRSNDESVMKAPVRPIPAEQFTITGGSGSSVGDACTLFVLTACAMKLIKA